MLAIFPAHRFNPPQIKAGVVENVISGGVALSGDEDVISTDGGGRWRVTYSGIAIRTVALQRLWDQWVSHMAGGAQPILLPLVSLTTAPRPFAGNGLARPSAIYANDSQFPTEVRFASPYIVATTVGAVAPRATTITIAVAQGARIQGGERCSIGSRALKIERVLSRPTQMSAVCKVSPPTREAIASGTSVNFEWPVVQAKAVPGQDLDPDIAYGRNGTVSITFVEDFSDVA